MNRRDAIKTIGAAGTVATTGAVSTVIAKEDAVYTKTGIKERVAFKKINIFINFFNEFFANCFINGI